MQGKFQRAFASVLGELGTPVFLAGLNPSGSWLTLHVRAGCDAARLKSRTQLALEQAGEPIRVSVRVHNLRQLANPRSLEHWLKRFDAGHAVYDPTMVLSRARGLLSVAKSCRTTFGNSIGGFFFDPDQRTFFVLNRNKSDAATASAIRLRVESILRQTLDGTTSQPWINVQVVPDLPRRKLIPIDARSASLAHKVIRTIRRWLAPIAIALAVTGAAVPAAAHLDTQQAGRQAIGTSTVKNVRADNEFGVLFGLSVFADSQRRDELDAFASAGLRMYFGEASYTLAQIQQPKTKKRRLREQDPDITGQVPNSDPDITGQVGPGS
jgi:hypothetical protein